MYAVSSTAYADRRMQGRTGQRDEKASDTHLLQVRQRTRIHAILLEVGSRRLYHFRDDRSVRVALESQY